MLHVCTMLWDANRHSLPGSLAYDEGWAEKLYRAYRRNLTRPFRFVCCTDRPRVFAHPEIEQERLTAATPDYSCCIEPFRLDQPAIIAGLDTMIVGNIDALADYCMSAAAIAIPRDPYEPRQACNGVTLSPGGMRARMWDRFDGRNDMEWMRANPHVFTDDLFPGAVVSYKAHVARTRRPDDPPDFSRAPDARARIVYFHGRWKPPEIDADWVREHWR